MSKAVIRPRGDCGGCGYRHRLTLTGTISTHTAPGGGICSGSAAKPKTEGSSVDFTPYPKIARLHRPATISEKIDGTNGAIVIRPHDPDYQGTKVTATINTEDGPVDVGAQSRNRFVTPDADNAGFAAWVFERTAALVDVLGVGVHFGEFWGAGIQRRYDLTEKRFSLFNSYRWGWMREEDADVGVPGLSCVPVLYRGEFSTDAIQDGLVLLKRLGSAASPGFMRPEGLVIHHEGNNSLFKIVLDRDSADLVSRIPKTIKESS